MRVITFAGPPSVGKTSVVIKTVRALRGRAGKVGIVKFDCLSTEDDKAYRNVGLPVAVGLAAGICPDHFFVSNIDDCLEWARRSGFDILIAESAGLCNRCSPHIRGPLGICVIDTLSGIHTPAKVGPMLRLADVVVITKGDIVSQAEREVFAFQVRAANPRAAVLAFNGITGQGSTELGFHLMAAREVDSLEGTHLRFPMPSAVCPYCVGETAIGRDHQRGNVRKMNFDEAAP